MSLEADNMRYAQELIAQFEAIPYQYATEVATRIYQGLVALTNFDSGQAGLNWHLQPYSGTPVLLEQQILWGYGDVAPVGIAGYKWSGDGESIKAELIGGMALASIILRTQKFDGIVVYNPITPGFAGFSPATPDDTLYEFNALGQAEEEEDGVVAQALDEAEYAMMSEHHFVRLS